MVSELKNALEIDTIGLGLLGLYGLFFFFFFFFLLQKEKLNSRTICVLVVVSFIWPVVFFITNEIFHLKSTPPDTRVYASLILDFNTSFSLYSFGVKSYSILNFIQYKLCFKRPFIFIIFNIFYFHLAVLFIYKAFVGFIKYRGKSVNKKSFFTILLVLANLYPVTIIINTSILRESMALMFLALFIHLLVKYIASKKGMSPFLFLALLMIFIIRPLTGVCAVLVLFLSYCLKRKLYTPKNFLKLILVIAFLIIGVKYLVSNIYRLDYSLDWLIAYREASTNKFGTEGYETLNWSGVSSYVANICLLIAQYLLSPLPILVSPTVTANKLIPLIDTIYIVFGLIIPVVIFNIRQMRFWLVLFVCFLIIPALFETNISGAYRHRISAVFFLIPYVSYIISNIKLSSFYVRS